MGKQHKLVEKNGTIVYEDTHGKIFVHKKENQSVVVLGRINDRLIVIKQFQQPFHAYLTQLPGGGVESGESLEEAARREFLEETGYRCGRLHYLGNLLPAPWRCNEVTHVFFTEEVLEQADQQLEAHEKIQVVQISIVDCIQLLRENSINDSEISYAILQSIIQGFIPYEHGRD